MAHLIWSPQAVSDLEAICDYIAKDSQEYACIIARRIVNVVESIPDHPRAGRMVPEWQTPSLRERIVGSYRVIYRAGPEAVEIVTIIHGARVFREL